MKMSDLPPDLVEEILSRVPATSLKRLQSTCRQWNDLFKDQRFSEKHFGKATKESMILMLKSYRMSSLNVNLNVTPPSIEFQGELDLKDSHSNPEQVDITRVSHCDGLLLCTNRDNRLVVWNPCLGQTRWIQLGDDYKIASSFSIGYMQNNNSCRNYKILKRWRSERYFAFEIYEFSCDSWRVLDNVVLNCSIHHTGTSSGVSLKGNSYWVASDYRKEKTAFLISFDFTNERFKRKSLPLFQNHGHVTLSVGREEQLSVINWTNDTSEVEMWVTNKIDAHESELVWTKSFIVRSPSVCTVSNIRTSLYIDEEKKVSLCYSVGGGNKRSGKSFVYTIGEDDQYYTQISNTFYRQDHYHNITQALNSVFVNYVPSLIHIPTRLRKRKRKKISSQ